MSRLSGVYVLLACLCWLSSAVVYAADTDNAAADWPQWRGPQRDGIAREKGLLQRWTGKGPALEWQATGMGDGYASVAIAQGKILTMGKRKDTVYVMARDGHGGHQPWPT